MNTKLLLGGLAIACLAASPARAITVTTTISSGLSEPYNIVVDADNNYYISDSANHRIVSISSETGNAVEMAGFAGVSGSQDGPSYMATFNMPQGLLLVTNGTDFGLLVSDSANQTIRFVRISDAYVTTLAGQAGVIGTNNGAGINATFSNPTGLTQDGAGNVYIADSGNSRIRYFNLGDPSHTVADLEMPVEARLYNPAAIAMGGTNALGQNLLWIADSGNSMIKQITLTSPGVGVFTTYLGSKRSVGSVDSSYGPSARFNLPGGLYWNGSSLFVSDTCNHTIRKVTNNPSFGATNYGVVTLAGVAGSSGLVNGDALASKFKNPVGLAYDPISSAFLVADLNNNVIRSIQTGTPLSAVPDPTIGWVKYVADANGVLRSVLQATTSATFENDVSICIRGTDGTRTLYTYGNTPADPSNDTVPDPTTSSSSSSGYADGLLESEVTPYDLLPLMLRSSNITVKAKGSQAGRKSSSVVSCKFQFQTATPSISGNNAAMFTVSDVTSKSVMYYTTNGESPATSSSRVGPISSGTQLSFQIVSNMTFKIYAVRDSYMDSGVASQVFAASNYSANKITFGFASGEASSDFVASPGQTFVAPVTLTTLAGTKMYSLQFNATVTNLGAAVPPVAPGAIGFFSTLVKPNPEPPAFVGIPTYAALSMLTNSVVITNVVGTNTYYDTNLVISTLMDPPPTWKTNAYQGNSYLDLRFVNSTLNLIGVAWLERAGSKNLYDTTKQDLIKYSMPHDTVFLEDDNQIVLGGFAFSVPASAHDGDTYRIRLGRPSATSDGIGASGSDVYIEAPTNTANYYGGTLNAVKTVTVGQRKYVAGDAAPFRWFNAGDFGNGLLKNDDVEQVFEAAIYDVNTPPAGSDFFDSMDSCGALGVDSGLGYLVPASTNLTSAGDLNPLFDGNDTSINNIAFGDGKLDICDVYVTLRRSLDPSLTWYRRFWTNGVLGAEAYLQPAYSYMAFAAVPDSSATKSAVASVNPTNQPSIRFSCGDVAGSAGQTVQIPVTAQVFGSYPLRLLMLGLSVNALDGAPALAAPIQFTPNAALGTPYLVKTNGNASYSAAWLDSTVTGLSGTVMLGYLTVTIPSTATSLAAYAVSFSHVSASPNGLASFPNQTVAGLVTLAARTNSSYNDGIPDAWRLKYFGTVNNALSQANADADGDGLSNLQEYLAGTDPNNASSTLKTSTYQAAAHSKQDCVIQWPTVAGKTYLIERSASLYGSQWSPVGTNVGSGSTMEFHDTNGGSVRFYRVRVQQ
jgi:hypothetical protein